MTTLTWDEIGERVFQTGVDRGVLFPIDGPGVAWNGLTSVEETTSIETKEHYLEGMKYLQYQVLSQFSGKLKAVTYPDEFDSINGIEIFIPGAFVHDQKPKPFGLSYRTKLGNDTDGADHGYRIHVLWNLLATPDPVAYSSMAQQTTPIEFSWNLSATPQFVEGHRPTAHLSFRSTDLDEDALAGLESLLYGTPEADPILPSIDDLIALLTDLGIVTIIDNGDGSWTASGFTVQVLFPGQFVIDDVDASTEFDDDGNPYYEMETTG